MSIITMAATMGERGTVKKEKHIKFFHRCLQILPARYSSLDSSRMTIAFFAISGLDMLNAVGTLDKDKEKIINWIYSLQVVPNQSESNLHQCGFRGSSSMQLTGDAQVNDVGGHGVGGHSVGGHGDESSVYDSGHIAMTYTALLSLLILGDDLSRIDRRALLCGLRKLQLPDGSYCPTPEGSENDMRFLYCASSISYILNDWSGMDCELAVDYITRSQTYEGGFAQGPGLEAHGGSTFCAIASLHLMGRVYDTLSPHRLKQLRRWCLFRQESGFNGRPNKPVDTCYSFWIGATLELMSIYALCDPAENRLYLMDTQDSVIGGFAKWPSNDPDALHSYFGLCGLSLMGTDLDIISTMYPALNISCRAADRLSLVHADWELRRSVPVSADVHRRYVQFFKECVRQLPEHAVMADTSRGAVVYFCVSGLDVLRCLSFTSTEVEPERCQYIDWIHKLYIQSTAFDGTDVAGFQGYPSTDNSCCDDFVIHDSSSSSECCRGGSSSSHVTMTYVSLCSLIILGDDLSRLNRSSLLHQLSFLQKPDGSFCPCIDSTQTDIKFLYCSVCIAYMLQDFSAIDTDLLIIHIKSCMSYEGGFGHAPGLEAHGAATYFAISALVLCRRVRSALSEREICATVRWCLSRLSAGFVSRTNKQPSTSYFFWISATLKLLGALPSGGVTTDKLMSNSCDSSHAGDSLRPPTGSCSSCCQDPLAMYYAVCGLSLNNEPGTRCMNAALCISDRAERHLRELQQRWLQQTTEH